MDITKLFSLEGRVALVTGGSKNLGRHIAEGFIAQGAKVYISSRKADACAQTAEELGLNCIALPMDVSSVEGCKALAAAFAAREEKLDILVNNAGAAWGGPFEDFPEVGWDKVMDTNVKGVFFLTQKLLPLMTARSTTDDPSRIVNIGRRSPLAFLRIILHRRGKTSKGLSGYGSRRVAGVGRQEAQARAGTWFVKKKARKHFPTGQIVMNLFE